MDIWTAFKAISLAWFIVMMAIMIGWAIYGSVEAVRKWRTWRKQPSDPQVDLSPGLVRQSSGFGSRGES